ncbi:TerD family protein [Streptomyces resistomycificus]|uniref:Export associated protein n=1 Tax=Streptomyces resistomycificus TaxID=67356 RepID=A0A0L8L6D9_9ACTN|nr:TerD family protein [Streptomyces resistomycificus]KOG33685.1 export associated protein [Streptomyces resistomycificus]KUN93901.1 export associated protein [Streptomyces resistomycificus]
MTAELVRGQNHPLSQARLEIRVAAGTPIVAGATLSDEHGKVHGAEWVAHPGAPTLPGLEVSRQAAADHRLAVDLGAVPEAVHRVSVLLALPSPAGAAPPRFGAVPAPFLVVTDLDGTEIASYTITGLDAESAVVALELYRRQGAWKVRAIGQGYAGGLAELLGDQGLDAAHQLASGINEAVAQGLARSVPAPPRPTDTDRPRQPAAPALGGDQGGPAPQATTGVAAPHPAPPYGNQPPGALNQPASPYDAQGVPGAGAPQPPTSPYGTHNGPAAGAPSDGAQGTAAAAAPTDGSAARGQGSAGVGGPIDYSHPRRRSAAPPPAPTAPPARPGQPALPVAGDATGWSMDERLYNQVWGMFEDLARTAAAYRSAVDFADSRMEKELDQVLSDPRSRIGGQGDAAREAARAKHAQLVEQATAALERDLTQLTAEAEVVEPALPPAYARWDNPVWHGYRVPTEVPMALRLGDLRLPEAAELRIPMLVRLPLERGLWIDSGQAGTLDDSFADSHDLRRLAMETAVAHAARLLAVYPAGEFTVHVIDPAGSAAQALSPLVRTGVLAAPPALGAAGVADVLGRLTERVDLVQMAVRAGAADSLPPDLDTAEQLLIVNDFPHGFDDRAVTRLRYLADEGPAVGVHLMMVADREEAAGYGPLLDPLWRSLLRITPVPDDHLADPWVGHAWTYEPSLVPNGSQVLQQVLQQVATARTKYT